MTREEQLQRKMDRLYKKELKKAENEAGKLTQRVSYIGGKPLSDVGLKTVMAWMKNGEVQVVGIRPAKELLELDAVSRKVLGQKLLWYGAFDKNHYGAVYQQ